MYWRLNGAFEGVCWRVCVSELCYHVNVPPPAPTSRPGRGELWKRKKNCRVFMFPVFYSGGSRISHSFLLFSFFLFSFCTITFLVFVWSRTKKKKKQVSNNPVYKSVKTRRLYFEKVLYRSLSLALSLFPLFFSSSDKQHTSVQPSVVTYRQHSDWLTAKNVLWN